MRRSMLWTCALLAIATSGCEQFNAQFAKLKQKIAERRGQSTSPAPAGAAPARPHPAPATDAAPTEPSAPASPTPPAASPNRPARRGQRSASATGTPESPEAFRDVPYDSPDTGTVAPGMSERDVYALWGAPVAVRRQGEWTYLFFRNGCEYTCGTEDIVTLQNGHVVDAVLRWPGHGYSGQSSSPSGTMPHPNPGGDTLTVRPPGTP